jgi:hypothetical protein
MHVLSPALGEACGRAARMASSACFRVAPRSSIRKAATSATLRDCPLWQCTARQQHIRVRKCKTARAHCSCLCLLTKHERKDSTPCDTSLQEPRAACQLTSGVAAKGKSMASVCHQLVGQCVRRV